MINKSMLKKLLVFGFLSSFVTIGYTQNIYSSTSYRAPDGIGLITETDDGRKFISYGCSPAEQAACDAYLDQIVAEMGYTKATSDADFYGTGSGTSSTPAFSQITTSTPKTVKGSYVLLATGEVIKPGGSIPFSQLASAVFVNGTGQDVMYTAIATNGVYKAKYEPEPNWAYVGSVASGGAIPLSSYAAWMADPYNTHLTIELRGSKDYEYSFAINKAQ